MEIQIEKEVAGTKLAGAVCSAILSVPASSGRGIRVEIRGGEAGGIEVWFSFADGEASSAGVATLLESLRKDPTLTVQQPRWLFAIEVAERRALK